MILIAVPTYTQIYMVMFFWDFGGGFGRFGVKKERKIRRKRTKRRKDKKKDKENKGLER